MPITFGGMMYAPCEISGFSELRGAAVAKRAVEAHFVGGCMISPATDIRSSEK